MSSVAPLEQRPKERQKERYPDEREDHHCSAKDVLPLEVLFLGSHRFHDGLGGGRKELLVLDEAHRRIEHQEKAKHQ